MIQSVFVSPFVSIGWATLLSSLWPPFRTCYCLPNICSSRPKRK